VEVGEFNDEFIEIKKGLKEGDRVLLQAPETAPEKSSEESKPPENGKPAAPAAKPGASPTAAKNV
jgi:hypothetical protein